MTFAAAAACATSLYHWRGNVAVLLGVAVGTAVLTGALLVGDSLRGSLRDLALRRLGWVDQALVAPRFFREALADELYAAGAAERVCPAILLQATAAVATTRPAGSADGSARHRRRRRRPLLGRSAGRRSRATRPLAQQHARPCPRRVGRAIQVRAAAAEAERRAAREPAGPARTPTASWTTGAVESAVSSTRRSRPTTSTCGPSLEAPRIAFVPLHLLQDRLGLEGPANALLVAGGNDLASSSERQR